MDIFHTEQDAEFLTEIAIAYYENQQTQEEIAQHFGISRIKVGRLLKKAREEGIVEILVRYHPIFSSKIEQQFIQQFNIQRTLIAVDYQDEEEQRQQVGSLVTNYLASILKNGMTVAVGQGRNVAAVASHIGVYPEKQCKFISGIGGTLRAGELIDADHICRTLARKFNATSETLYAPAYVENKNLKLSFMKNRVIQETLDRARKADVALVGIGDMNENSYMVQLGWFSPQEIIDAKVNLGLIGDIAGYGFLNINGEFVDTVMNDRVIGLSIEELKNIPCVIGIASEKTKPYAILAALRSGVIDVIATSASNAKAILQLQKKRS